MINETSSNFYDSLNIFPNNVKKIQFWSILCSIKWAKLGRSHGGSRAMMGSQERTVWSLEDTTCIWEGYLHIWWKEYNIYVFYILWLNRITLDFKKNFSFLAVNLYSHEILSDLKIVEMWTWTGQAGRAMVVRQEVWAITLILGEEREECSVHSHVMPVREQGPTIQSKWLNKNMATLFDNNWCKGGNSSASGCGQCDRALAT